MQHPREILEHVHAYIAAQGYFYPKQDIANLYLALKTKPFVILSGVSGTGKTQLVRQFAAALGLKAQFLHIAVRPDWQDQSDLLGYTDLQGNFVCRPFLAFLLKAHAQPTVPHFILLDEMNLARVEYYLADILSLMETRRREEGRIISDPLFSRHSFPAINSSNEALVGLGLPDNVYLIGTANIDESSYRFSRKVMDRANVIEMNEVYLDLPMTAETIPPLDNVPNSLLKSPFLTLAEIPISERSSLEKPLRWLIDMHDIMKQADQPLGYRLRDEMLFYLYHRLEIRELISEAEAVDRQICQKILPRLEGSSHRVVQAVYAFIRLLAGPDKLSEHLMPYTDVYEAIMSAQHTQIPFRQSLQKLMVMYRRYEEDGFVSYWM